MRTAWQCEETLAFLEPLVPEILVDPPRFIPIRASASLLPEGASAYFLECRLAAGDSRVDFGACFRSPREGRGGGAPEGESGPPENASVWREVAETFSLWRTADSRLSRHVPYIWLEVDGPHAGDGAPGVLFCVDADMAREPALFAEASHAGLLGVAQEASGLLFGAPLAPATRKALLACSAFLPRSARIHHVSAMPSRGPGGLKLNISLPKSELAAYLESIGWPGSRKALEPVWEAFHPFMDFAKVDLAIGEGVAPALGLELHAFNASLPGRIQALREVEAMGIGDPGKCRSLADWSGRADRTYRGHRWPTRINLVIGLKLVLRPAGGVEAKGYLGAFPECALSGFA